MAIDAAESPSSPSQSLAHSIGQSRHFYIAVDRIDYKMLTFVELLGEVGRRSGLPMVVCCNSRDELDAVCYTVSSLPYISLSSLYSDLAESDRAQVLDTFRYAAIKWNQGTVQSTDGEDVEEELKSHMVVVTDACLPIASTESPVPARVLINYELPLKKDVYMRRMAACLAPDGIVINMVVGGEVVTLKSIEEACNLIIAELPIQVSEIL
ncbi:unnamed protein product [Amaranthus hypochondriacus]